MTKAAPQSAVLPTYARTRIAFTRGEGVWLEADDGRRFLDFGAGIAVNALGHCHPHLVSTLKAQADRLWHTSNLYEIEGQERLAARLCAATFADFVFFANSGVEALECAIKMARKFHAATGAPERYRMITFEGAFHGRTLTAIAAGGQEKYLEGFGPKVDGFDQVPFHDMDAVKTAIGPQTAGILLEPIQGEGGIREFPDAFLRDLRALCDAHGILLVLDEVQTGVGRTGKLFAHEWAGITPDIMAVAKGIGGGFPLGACLATRAAAQGMTAGSHGSTYGGNPLAMAVGNAVLDVVLDEGFLDHVRRMGTAFQQRLAGLRDTHGDAIEEIRGRGLMLGLKLRVPNGKAVAAFLAEGLLAVPAGENTVRLLPPLIVTEEDIVGATERMDRAFTALASQTAGE
jgi:acetylornithine/N-succinyldiaminopimelate aminotransferase